MENFTAPALWSPALLPPELDLSSLAAAPIRVPGGEPPAILLLIEIEMQGLEAGAA